MRQSELFSKTRKDAPKDEAAKNAELLIRAGFVHKNFAGVYSFLPLGRIVLDKIVGIIRAEMNALDGQEISLPALQEKFAWEETERWSDEQMDVWFRTDLKNGTTLGLAPTHEEPLTLIAKEHISSYRDLPAYLYQFQTKFRNESRAKSGLLRMREFLMKDMYSFSLDEKSHAEFYEKAKAAYARIFDAVGIGASTFLTFASGGSFSKFSHEFQMLTDAGEDTVYVSKNRTADGEKIAVNKEVLTPEVLAELGLSESELEPHKAIEVGNIFSLGTRFSEKLGLVYDQEGGGRAPVFMGSYGIGPGRLMGAIVEVCSDEKGIVWPASVAPFQIHLVNIATDEGASASADALYKELAAKSGAQNGAAGASAASVLYDDRDTKSFRAGAKFADSDLIGIPMRVIVSDKTFAVGQVEVVDRKSGETKVVSTAEFLREFGKSRK